MQQISCSVGIVLKHMRSGLPRDGGIRDRLLTLAHPTLRLFLCRQHLRFKLNADCFCLSLTEFSPPQYLVLADALQLLRPIVTKLRTSQLLQCQLDLN